MIYDEQALERAIRDALGFAIAKIREQQKIVAAELRERLAVAGCITVLTDLRFSKTLVADIVEWLKNGGDKT